MDDLDRLIEKKENEKPGFAAAVEKRKGELLIAARLREARENLKLTQAEVAKKWSLSQQSISKIENARDDHISLHTLNEYARVLGYELQFVLRSAPN
ncbi:MAG: helix-turn-helix transcriptional regulator [Deltaproteobacteria bacterium]|uniref:Helix-turn-helix transcriptional regulator n=1 Tax=Candidatus Desulfacyla euxinica TaxID=2841693 RepID=A0A8J6N107_9DELT|nr:helix-turn-helix transcriptional regulator [Candidatus Desulfacyla euxinica]